KRTITDRHIDPLQFLVHDTTGTQVQVAYFAVAHLAFRKPHHFTERDQGSVRVFTVQGTYKRNPRMLYGIAGGYLSEPPSVHDQQYDFLLIHATKLYYFHTKLPNHCNVFS